MTRDGVEILVERALRGNWHTGFSKKSNVPKAAKAVVDLLIQFKILHINDSNVGKSDG